MEALSTATLRGRLPESAASVAVTIADPGVKSGAISRISATEMTTSPFGLASGLGLAIATLMLLMFRRPKARPGNMHKRPASKNLDILGMDFPAPITHSHVLDKPR